MSYCRMSKNSDVYVIATGDGKGNAAWECVACPLAPEDEKGHPSPLLHSRVDMISHLAEHLAANHKVPARAIIRLAKELAKDIARE